MNINYYLFHIQCSFKHFFGELYYLIIITNIPTKYELYLNSHHWFICTQSCAFSQYIRQLIWGGGGGGQLCYINMLQKIWWWTFEARHLPDECCKWSRNVCAWCKKTMITDHARMFALPFTIFNVHKIKYKCNAPFKMKLNCEE